MALQYSTAHRTNDMTQLVTDIGSSGTLVMYSGTPPVNVGTALSGNSVLATFACASPFGTVASGVLTMTAPANVTAAAGTATFFRILTSGGTATVQGTLGASGADINIAGGTTFTAGQTVALGSYSITATGA